MFAFARPSETEFSMERSTVSYEGLLGRIRRFFDEQSAIAGFESLSDRTLHDIGLPRDQIRDTVRRNMRRS